jgi:hypothetical protein
MTELIDLRAERLARETSKTIEEVGQAVVDLAEVKNAVVQHCYENLTPIQRLNLLAELSIILLGDHALFAHGGSDEAHEAARLTRLDLLQRLGVPDGEG